MTAAFRRPHDFPVDPPVGRSIECRACGYVLGPGADPKPLCPGPPDERARVARRGSRLERRTQLKRVSDRRDEKLAARGARGEFCDFVRGRPCAVPRCNGTSDPAHVKSVGAGWGDFLRRDGRWVGNVADLCRVHHRFLDGIVGGGGSPDAFEAEYGVDPRARARILGRAWMEDRGVDAASRTYPYEQLTINEERHDG